MTAFDKLIEVSAFLKKAGIEDAPKEAEILITEALKISKSRLYTSTIDISDRESKMIDEFAFRRSQKEPLQYIIGYVEFYGLRINVGKGVLIPRPETELLVKETIKLISEKYTSMPHLLMGGKGRVSILDLCTGSGCIATALARHFTDAEVYGIDISDVAIQYAIKNAEMNNVKNVHFLKGNLFEPISVSEMFKFYFDCIVSNPPYIKSKDIQKLQREIRDYEPIAALDGGKNGLDFYRRIFKDAPQYIKEDGFITLEIGFEQADDVLLIANKAGFSKVNFIKDYSGIERICIAKR